MVVNADMVDADVSVMNSVPPSPTEGAPPWIVTSAPPTPGGEADTKTDAPGVSEARSVAVGAGPTHPVGADVRPVIPPAPIDHDIIRGNHRSEVTGSVADINSIRS